MTGEQFLKQILEPSTKKVGTEVPYGMMSTLKRYMNHDPYSAPSKYRLRIFLWFLFCSKLSFITKFNVSDNVSSYSYGDTSYVDSNKEQEEETVLEEIMRKAAIGRYLHCH